MLKIQTKFAPGEQGFALVATLMVLPLLAILVMGLLGISSIEMRKSSTQIAQIEARANARLALTLAIGDLQKHLGPDQRVSTDSRILEGSNSGSSDLKQPHWVNVWRTTQEDGSPFITRSAQDGGLRDSRSTGSRDAESERIACLVSGNENKMVYSDGPSSSVPNQEDMVELVGKASIGDSDDNNRVSAPRVEIAEGEDPRGSYAWWVGDLGIRANVATPDAAKVAGGSLAAIRASLLSQDASWSAVDKQPDLDNTVRSKLVSNGQLALASGDPAAAANNFHDFTVDSLGVLADVRGGGLKKDLTAYLASNGSVPGIKGGGRTLPGVSDGDKLVGPRNADAEAASGSPGQAARLAKVSPDFGLLRDWADRAAGAPYGSYSTSADYPETTSRGGNGRLQLQVKYKERTKTDLTPVLVEGSLYYNLSFYPLSAPDKGNPYGMRLHLYPRVVLWNPYNFDMKLDASMINLHINGKKTIQVSLTGGQTRNYKMFWGLSGGSSTGSSQQGNLFFKLSGATLGPGESMVWSPVSNQIYNEGVFSGNLLSPNVSPSPTRSFYQDARADKFPLFAIEQTIPLRPDRVDNRLPSTPTGWREYVKPKPPGDVQLGNYTQADDYVMVWKPLKGASSSITESGFNALPMGRFISCAYQYGDEDEMPVVWSDIDPVPFPQSTLASPSVPTAPDRRTRDGFRLRWFDEHPSNLMGSGSLANTPHFEGSAIGNWNMRGSYSLRTPFENVTDVAPNFFGIYTRDLFDGAVDWNEMSPHFQGGTYRGDPFEQPVRFSWPRVLFDVPRTGAEISSLGALQHVSFSEFIWHPTYALGNSLADPRIELDRTEPRRSNRLNSDKGGWNQDTIGYNLDGRSNPNSDVTSREDSWAYSARSILEQTALDQTLIYDLSYELNHSLWDEFFLSSGTPAEKSSFVKNPAKSPLPNGRMRLNATHDNTESDLLDFHRAASQLTVDGAFNVNSTSVKAWEAMLLSSAGSQFDGDTVTFPRVPSAMGGQWDGKDVRSKGAWAGQRTFSRAEITKLATEIVVQVKTRGPFLSLGDFVNRRLSNDEAGKKGALQAAIDRAGLNARFEAEWPLNNNQSLPTPPSADHISDPTRLEQRNKPATTAWGALGFLTQADLLQFLGPALSVRSDTFVVRAYGSSVGTDGKTQAQAWCEAVVQRTPEPVDPDDSGLNPRDSDGEHAGFGRRFQVKRFRWLNREEI